MRTRSTRSDAPIFLSTTRWLAGALAALALISAGPVRAQSDESDESDASRAEQVVLKGVDMTIVRPLAAVRAGIGSILLVPAAILATPACFVNLANNADCRPVYETPYDVLVAEPAEYAFSRPMGEL